MTTMRRALLHLVPSAGKIYTAAYAAGLVMGVGFLIGTSPTLSAAVDQPMLMLWHACALVGSSLAILGRVRRNLRIEMAGLVSLVSALCAYGIILMLSVLHDLNPRPWTLVGLVGMSFLAAGLAMGRVGMIVEDLRTITKYDAIGA